MWETSNIPGIQIIHVRIKREVPAWSCNVAFENEFYIAGAEAICFTFRVIQRHGYFTQNEKWYSAPESNLNGIFWHVSQM